jgi:phosphate transport system protein
MFDRVCKGEFRRALASGAVPDELRLAYHEDMRKLDRQVLGLFALVGESVGGATDALLSGDREAAKRLVARDELIDRTYVELEQLVERLLVLQAPVAGDLRFLLTVLRIVPELERSADLAEHIAQRAARGITPALSPRVRGIIEQAGRVAVDLWHRAADAYAERDGSAFTGLDELDDELDDLRVSLTAEISTGEFAVPVVIELALVARFYERLGDHAVNVARQVQYVSKGREES